MHSDTNLLIRHNTPSSPFIIQIFCISDKPCILQISFYEININISTFNAFIRQLCTYLNLQKIYSTYSNAEIHMNNNMNNGYNSDINDDHNKDKCPNVLLKSTYIPLLSQFINLIYAKIIKQNKITNKQKIANNKTQLKER